MHLVVLPAGYSNAVQIATSIGNKCVWLAWDWIDPSAISGYNVYRNGTKINSTLLTGGSLLDTAVTAGTAYQYTVKVVDLIGKEVFTSTAVSATPAATGQTASWPTPPTMATDTVTLHLNVAHTDYGGLLFVDGVDFGGAQEGDAVYGTIGQSDVNVDTVTLTNGSHVFQYNGEVNGVLVVTPPLTLTVTNDFASYSLDDEPDPSTGDVTFIQATPPAGTVNWSVQVLDANLNVIRNWQGNDSTIHLAWDGNDASGADVPDGDYSISIIAYDAQHNQKQKLGPKHHAKTHIGLALIDNVSTTTKGTNIESGYKDSVQGLFDTLHQISSSFSGKAYFSKTDPMTVPVLLKRLKQANISIQYSHGISSDTGGTAAYLYFGKMRIWPNRFSDPKLRDKWQRPGMNLVLYNDVVKQANGSTHSFAFVFLDACRTAGGKAANDEGINSTVDYNWAIASGILSTDGSYNQGQVFFGWDGDAVQVVTNDGTANDWLAWRKPFLYALGLQDSIADAFTHAVLHYTAGSSTIQPYDSLPNTIINRAQIVGDTLTALP